MPATILDSDADAYQPQAIGHDHPEYTVAVGPERHTNPDLSRSLNDI